MGFFFFLLPAPPFYPPYPPLSVLLLQSVRAHMHAITQTWKSEGKFGCPFWLPFCLRKHLSLVVHRCVLQANWPRGLQGFPCFLLPTLHRPSGISDVHCSIQLSADPGDFNSDAHVCMICALPTRSFSHHQSVLFLLRQSKVQVSFLSPPYGGTGG